jgi:ferredoxin-NADP reductase
MSVLAKITQIQQETPLIRSFRLEFETSDFSFLPGQWVDFYANIEGNLKVAGYSIVSLPSQKSFIDIAVKKIGTNPVTNYLHTNVKVGDIVYVDGGYGDFYFTKKMGTSVVLISGGIGVTPLLGILRYIQDEAPEVKATMIYSAKTQNEFLFYDEFLKIMNKNNNINCIFTITQSEETESWNGHRGRITIDLINKANLNPNTIFYICGPPKMVENLNQLLLISKIPDKQIHIETW